MKVDAPMGMEKEKEKEKEKEEAKKKILEQRKSQRNTNKLLRLIIDFSHFRLESRIRPKASHKFKTLPCNRIIQSDQLPKQEVTVCHIPHLPSSDYCYNCYYYTITYFFFFFFFFFHLLPLRRIIITIIL